MKIVFIGSDDFDQAYTRVRCYQFSSLLADCGYRTEVFSLQDRYRPGTEPFHMLNLKDLDKLRVTAKVLRSMLAEKGSLFYVQKAHYHAAVPFLLSRAGRNPYILDYDDWELDRATFFDSKLLNRLFFKGTGVEEITRNIASGARACVVSTEPLLEFMRRYNPKVHLIPTATDTDRFTPSKSSKNGKKVVFIWTGLVWGTDVYESVMFMVDCFRSVHGFYSESELHIAGKGGMFEQMKKTIKQDYGDLPVAIMDWVHPDEMPRVLGGADVGLLPLIPNEKNMDWMRCKCPTKLFEFMAMGLPTVASRFGEAQRIINDGECGFLAKDKEEFIEKMKRLASDGELRREMGAMARELAVSRFSLRSQRDALREVIEGAIEPRGYERSQRDG